jgi:hypothetical protein
VRHPVDHAPDPLRVEDPRLLDEGLSQRRGSLWAASGGVKASRLSELAKKPTAAPAAGFTMTEKLSWSSTTRLRAS